MIYTIGFTQTSAEHFFTRLKENGVQVIIDVRLNNRSQLAGFAKYPDIEWFLSTILKIEYKCDTQFAPTEDILKSYQKKEIDWSGYEERFHELMNEREIEKYISRIYGDMIDKNICFLCSEPTAEHCHRRLVAEIFSNIFETEVKHL